MRWRVNILNYKNLLNQLQAFNYSWKYVGSGASIFLVLFGAMFFFQPTKQHTREMFQESIDWHPYAMASQSESGYLLRLQNKKKGIGIYVATDKEPSREDYFIAPGWEVTTVSYDRLWNPRVCAQMPVVVLDSGDIVMLDTRRNENRTFSSFLIRFVEKKSEIFESNVTTLNYRGSHIFYTKSGNPFFFGVTEQTLYAYTIDDKGKFLEKHLVQELREDEKAKINMDSEHQPLVSIYDSESVTRTYRYDESELKILTGDIPNGPIRYLGEEYKIYTLRNTVEVWYHLGEFFETKITHDNNTILEFKNASKIYAYGIGSYADSD